MSAVMPFPVPQVNVEKTGSVTVLSNAIALPDTGNQTMLDKLDYWAKERPEAIFLAERNGEDWTFVSYSAFYKRVISTAQALMSLELGPSSPLLLLAPNSIDHAVVAYAAMYIGVPVSPVSPAYALVAKTFERLQQVIDILKPGAVYVNNATLFSRSLDSISGHYDFPIVASSGEHKAVKKINDLAAISEEKVFEKRSTIRPDTLAKILFTSGSTGVPKGVLNTHKMMYSNQLALSQVWPFLIEQPPVLVDWLPWSHTFGGNVSFNSVLFHGGRFYIDSGKPSPQLICETVKNIKHGLPSIHFNVPAGVEALLPYLEEDKDFCRKFLGNLHVLFVAAAALPQKARDRITAAAESAGVNVPNLLGGWGSTETAPFSTAVYFNTSRADNIGVPIPGTKIKLSPNQDKLELSVLGPNVTTGYWRNDKATKAAFDKEGFYNMGDAGKQINDADPSEGIVFDGRISENFKLASGTWVNVGALRVAAIDCLRPYCLDAVVTGHNQSDIGLMVIPNMPAIAKKFALDLELNDTSSIAKNNDVVSCLLEMIGTYNKKNKTSTTMIKRFSILPIAPRIEQNEITDKGYLNQRKLLQAWGSHVAAMHAENSKEVTYYLPK